MARHELTVIILSLVVAGLAAAWDWRTGRIPNWLTLPLLVLVPLGQLILGGREAALGSLMGLLGCGLAPYLLFRMNAIGGGDVKLFAVLGALNGFGRGIDIFLTILVVGALQACLLLFVRGQLRPVMRRTAQMIANLFRPPHRRTMVHSDAMTEMRLGPALLLGTLVAFLGA